MDFGEDRWSRSHGQARPVDVMPAIAYASDGIWSIFVPSLACLVSPARYNQAVSLPGATRSVWPFRKETDHTSWIHKFFIRRLSMEPVENKAGGVSLEKNINLHTNFKHESKRCPRVIVNVYLYSNLIEFPQLVTVQTHTPATSAVGLVHRLLNLHQI